MVEPLDMYSDYFEYNINTWGARLAFGRQSLPTEDDSDSDGPLCTIRMGHSHLKVLVYMVHRGMMEHEAATDVQSNVPAAILGDLGIDVAKWDAFWGHHNRSS